MLFLTVAFCILFRRRP